VILLAWRRFTVNPEANPNWLENALRIEMAPKHLFSDKHRSDEPDHLVRMAKQILGKDLLAVD